jgi:catechol 2,3-dioxygenase-like lactoylglutathione lyase family enzyme
MEIDHVAVTSTNIDESVRWYKKFLNEAEVLYQDETWAFMQSGPVKFAFVTPGQHPPHIAVRVDTKEQEDFLVSEFPKKKWKLHRDGSASFYTRDNCGNFVEFIKYSDKED